MVHLGLRDFFAGVDERGVEEVVEAGVDDSALASDEDGSVGDVLRRVDGGSNERVAPDSSLSSATVEEGERGCESMSRRALSSTVVSALRKLTRLETVCVGRMLSLIARGGVLVL